MASHLLEKVAQDGTNSLRERVYRHLEAALREGQLHHGTCLDQDRLCEELGVSRTPLRDALLRLEAEGFVTIQPRKGVYITPVSDAFVKSACQILGALEADCLDTVFPLLTSRHIRQLEESNKRQEQFSNGVKLWNITRKTPVSMTFSCHFPPIPCCIRPLARCGGVWTCCRITLWPMNRHGLRSTIIAGSSTPLK